MAKKQQQMRSSQKVSMMRGKKAVRKENAFEKISSRKKFNVLGKKTKGDVKRTTQLRSDAVEKRKNTLLVEYRQFKKNNEFVDRRFGEDDDLLTQEEKALLRFQKQRMKDMAGSKFSLADEDDDGGYEEKLTHLGQSIDELPMDKAWQRELEQEEQVGQDATDLLEQYNFGGGESERDEGNRHKSRKEIMEEVIAKSKMFKAMKAKQKEGDLEATDALDEAWRNLSQQNVSDMMRPKGSRYEETKKSKSMMSEEDKKFDALTRELVFEAKAHAGDRTLTREELAELERTRLEELEKERMAREKGGDDLEDDFEGVPSIVTAKPKGGYAARRARLLEKEDVSESESGSDQEELEEDEEGLNALEKRRRKEAAGDHPLQEIFRGMAAKLLAKHDSTGRQTDESGSSEEEEEQEEQSIQSTENSEEKESEHDEEVSVRQQEQQKEAMMNSKNKREGDSGDADTFDMTFTPALPASYEEFESLVEGLDAQKLSEMLSRIRAYNAKELSEGGRKKLQVLYGCILQHFSSLSAMSPLPFDKLDVLTSHIIEIAPLIPFYSGMLSRARLERENNRFRISLKDALGKADAWPSSRPILLAKLLSLVYPVTDKRHPVLTPLSLFLSSNLTFCPIVKPIHASKGLIISEILHNIHSRSGRMAPEALSFAETLLDAFVKFLALDQENEDLGWMKNFSRRRKSSRVAYNTSLDLQKILMPTEKEDSSYFDSLQYLDSLLLALLKFLEKLSKNWDCDAYPEMFEFTMNKLEELQGHASEKVCLYNVSVLHHAEGLLEQIRSKAEAIQNSRRPLFSSGIARPPVVKQFNPRFEEDFVKGKDYDPDRERAEERKLKKQIRKEERGAIRELRKDAAFMAAVRDQEKARLQARLDNSAKRAISFLQQQESDFKSGGQGGMWKKKKKK